MARAVDSRARGERNPGLVNRTVLQRVLWGTEFEDGGGA